MLSFHLFCKSFAERLLHASHWGNFCFFLHYFPPCCLWTGLSCGDPKSKELMMACPMPLSLDACCGVCGYVSCRGNLTCIYFFPSLSWELVRVVYFAFSSKGAKVCPAYKFLESTVCSLLLGTVAGTLRPWWIHGLGSCDMGLFPLSCPLSSQWANHPPSASSGWMGLPGGACGHFSQPPQILLLLSAISLFSALSP